jgi:hypothetical protein
MRCFRTHVMWHGVNGSRESRGRPPASLLHISYPSCPSAGASFLPCSITHLPPGSKLTTTIFYLIQTMAGREIGQTKPKSNKLWSLHPVRHNEVSRLLADEGLQYNFHSQDDENTCLQEYDTNITGRFICRNNRCGSQGWGSKKIAITIRQYRGNCYNARVYHQRCQACRGLGKPILDGTYAERVAYRIKKWAGIEMEPPPYGGESEKPHNTRLCEGCRAGHCTQAREYVYY